MKEDEFIQDLECSNIPNKKNRKFSFTREPRLKAEAAVSIIVSTGIPLLYLANLVTSRPGHVFFCFHLDVLNVLIFSALLFIFPLNILNNVTSTANTRFTTAYC